MPQMRVEWLQKLGLAAITIHIRGAKRETWHFYGSKLISQERKSSTRLTMQAKCTITKTLHNLPPDLWSKLFDPEGRTYKEKVENAYKDLAEMEWQHPELFEFYIVDEDREFDVLTLIIALNTGKIQNNYIIFKDDVMLKLASILALEFGEKLMEDVIVGLIKYMLGDMNYTETAREKYDVEKEFAYLENIVQTFEIPMEWINPITGKIYTWIQKTIAVEVRCGIEKYLRKISSN
jgi:hypothetical protein